MLVWKSVGLFCTWVFLAFEVQGQEGVLPPLVVYSQGDESSKGRYLAQKTASGEVPFFWLADTPWELPRALNMSEVEFYLKDRKMKEYNVLQMVAVFFNDLSSPNYNGEWAFSPNHSNPMEPNEAFFSHVDAVISASTTMGFYVALWPVWGSAYISPGGAPNFQLIFDNNSSYWYGNWIGKRYKDYSNIVWVLGGDTSFPLTSSQLEMYRNMAEGVAQGVYGGLRPSWNVSSPAWDAVLMSYHPTSGCSSSMMFEKDAWLDFNLVQSGWGRYTQIQPLVGGDYQLPLVKPTFMGEGAYEDDIYHITTDPWGVRLNGYWNVLSGGFGHTYGANGVYQFQPVNDSDTDAWPIALNFTGSYQMQWIKKIFTSVNFWDLIPDLNNTVIPQQGNAKDLTQVFAKYTANHDTIIVYTTSGLNVTIHCNLIPQSTINVTWFNPQNGQYIHSYALANPRTASCSFTPPVTPPANANDWVLRLT